MAEIWPPSGVKWYYNDKWVAIAHGDCREILPQLDVKVDFVLTDPPYGLNYNNGDLANMWESAFGGDISRQIARPIANDDEETANRQFQEMLRLVKKHLLKGGACCCCCCCGGGPKPLFAKWTLWMDEIIGFKQAVVWDKGGLGMGMHFRRNYEFLLIGQNGNPAHRWNGGNNTPNIWHFPKIIPREYEHPTAKPEALFAKAITLFSDPYDLVIDPFLGHGTTCRVSKNLNRYSIGIEIEEKFCDIAARRCMQSVLEPDMVKTDGLTSKQQTIW